MWALGSGWAMLAVAWTPTGPHGVMQLALLGGGAAAAAPHLYRHRQRPGTRPAPIPVAQLEAAPDPRLEAFRAKFCTRPGTALHGADLHGFEDVPDGFSFQLKLAEASDATTKDVVALTDRIAKLYDVPADQVSAEYSARRSEARAKITVLTAENALERNHVWDGVSTYNPQSGTIQLGRFLDSRPTHWLLYKPGSGAAGGVLAGVTGAGKTGTVHVVACEAGQARLCAVCGATGTCARCDRRRIAAIWMGDPQEQGLAVWRGRADLTAWGPDACVQMLSWAHAIMTARASWLGNLLWTDHLDRHNVGKGWFDPAVGFPLILVFIDEWPKIIDHPELGETAKTLAGQIGKEGRKTGVALCLMTQMPDLSQLGDRAIREMLKAFNVVCHRTDSISKHMLGVEGDPTKLPAGVHGVGFINGSDKRPSATFRTKYLPEYLQPGQTGIDVREIAGRIAADPIAYDQAVLDAIIPLGYTGPGQVLDGHGAVPAGPAPAPATAGAAVHPSTGATRAAGTLLRGPASLDAIARLGQALTARGAPAELYDVMQDTGLNALDAHRAAAALVAAGVLTRDQNDRYLPSTCTSGQPDGH